MKLQTFLSKLKAYSQWLTPQQYKTLRGQAIAGDIFGAKKGLEKILKTVEVTK